MRDEPEHDEQPGELAKLLGDMLKRLDRLDQVVFPEGTTPAQVLSDLDAERPAHPR